MLENENRLKPYSILADKEKAIVMSNDNGESDVTHTESEITCPVGNLSRGSRETPELPDSQRRNSESMGNQRKFLPSYHRKPWRRPLRALE